MNSTKKLLEYPWDISQAWNSVTGDHWDIHSMYHTGIVMRYAELHTMNERTTVGRF